MLPPPSTHHTSRPVRPNHIRTNSHSDMHYCCTCGGTLQLTYPSPSHPLGRLCCTLCLKAACRKCTISGYILPQLKQAPHTFDAYVNTVQISREKGAEANNLSFVCCECGWSALVKPSTTITPSSKSTTNAKVTCGSRVQRFLSGWNPLTKSRAKQRSEKQAISTTTIDFSKQSCSMCTHSCCSMCIKVQLGGPGGAGSDVVALMGGQAPVSELGVLETGSAQPDNTNKQCLPVDHAGRPIVDIPVPVLRESLSIAPKSSLKVPVTASYPRLQQQTKSQVKLYAQSRVQTQKHVRFVTPSGSAALPVSGHRRTDSGVGDEAACKKNQVESGFEHRSQVQKGQVALYACAYLPAPPTHPTHPALHGEGEGMPDSATLPPSILTFPRHAQPTIQTISAGAKTNPRTLLALLSPPPITPPTTPSPTTPLFPLFPVSPLTPTYCRGGGEGGRRVTPNRSASTLAAAAATRVLAEKVRKARAPEIKARAHAIGAGCGGGAGLRGDDDGEHDGESWGRRG